MGAVDRTGAPAAPLQVEHVERLYRQLGPKLHQFIRRQVPEPAIAADLLQDVFVRLPRAGVQLRSDGEMRSYLYRTANSVVAEHYRVRSLRRTVPFVAEDGDEDARDHPPGLQVQDEDTAGAGQRRARVERGFSRLGVRDRTLLWLAYVEEMAHAEIAAVVGVNAASVKVLLSRARARPSAPCRGCSWWSTPSSALRWPCWWRGPC
jgi:RNA polymerase sigma-70 factor (ECF subfamily)